MGAHTALPTLTSDTRVFVWRGHDTLWLHITTAYDVAQYAASKHPFYGGDAAARDCVLRASLVSHVGRGPHVR